MHTSNETIYHTDDLVALYDLAVIWSAPSTHRYYRNRNIDVKLLSVRYASWASTQAAYEDGRLSVKLPRRNKLQASALTALAGAAVDAPEGDEIDEGYCFLVPQTLCTAIVSSIISSLCREHVNRELPRMRLRYCNRLKKGQKQWQTIGSRRRHLEILEENLAAIKNQIAAAKENIKLSEEIGEKSKSRYKKLQPSSLK